MSSTAIGAISKDTRTITFISKEHEEFYLKYLTKCRWKDVYHKAFRNGYVIIYSRRQRKGFKGILGAFGKRL